jgi:quinate dehydrogenase (quinone)
MDEQRGSGRRIFFTVYRVIFVLLSFCTGLFFTFWGGKLLTLGGSAWYLLAGVAYLLIAIGYLIRSQYVLPFTIVTFLLTLVWALYEVQLSYWGLIPRLVVPALLLMLGLWLATTLPVKRTAVAMPTGAPRRFSSRCWRRWSRRFPHGGIHHGVVKAAADSKPTLLPKATTGSFSPAMPQVPVLLRTMTLPRRTSKT